MPNYTLVHSGQEVDKAHLSEFNDVQADSTAVRNLDPSQNDSVFTRGGTHYIWVDGSTANADNTGIVLDSVVDGYGPGEANEGRWISVGLNIHVDSFGADPLGVADSTAAINQALTIAFEQNRNASQTGSGQIWAVEMSGTYKVSDTILVPHQVALYGAGTGRSWNSLNADTGADWTNKPVVSLGGLRTQAPYSDSDQNAFGARVENIRINCNAAAPIGVETLYANELSGVEDCFIYKPRKWGILVIHSGAKTSVNQIITDLSPPAWFTTIDNTRRGSAQNFSLRNIEIFFGVDGEVDAGSRGIMIYGGGSDTYGGEHISITGQSDITSHATITDIMFNRSAAINDGITANKLVDTVATFQTDGVLVNDIVHNVTDDTYARVTAVDGETTLSLSADIFPSPSGDSYEVGPVDVAGIALDGVAGGFWSNMHLENTGVGFTIGHFKATNQVMIAGVTSNADITDTILVFGADAEAVKSERYMLAAIKGNHISGGHSLDDQEKNIQLTTAISSLAAGSNSRILTTEPGITNRIENDGGIAMILEGNSSSPLLQFINRDGTTAVFADNCLTMTCNDGINPDFTGVAASPDTIKLLGRSSGHGFAMKVRTGGTNESFDRFRLKADGLSIGDGSALPTKVVGEQQAAIASLTDSSGGSDDGTLEAVSGSGADAAINNNFSELHTKQDAILAALRAHGLIAT